MELKAKSWILVKAAYIRVKYAKIRILSFSRLLTSFYYVFASSYHREQRAVVAGLRSHLKDVKDDASFFLLRRNIHRIEKGLVLPNRRPIFALEYIGETIDYYGRCLNGCQQGVLPGEIDWATDVLHRYFDAVQGHPLVDTARETFRKLNRPEGTSSPYKRGMVSSPVTPEDFEKLVRQRKSVRTFLPKPVPRELVDKALAIAALSPSSCNRQPMRYRLFDEEPLLRTMAEMPLGTAGFADNIPMICALTGDLSAYSYERDRHSIYVDGCLSAMQFMLALETVGLSSCPLNWAEIDSLDRAFEKAAGLPPYERGIMFIAIGYADPEGYVAFSERKSLDELRCYNTTGDK